MDLPLRARPLQDDEHSFLADKFEQYDSTDDRQLLLDTSSDCQFDIGCIASCGWSGAVSDEYDGYAAEFYAGIFCSFDAKQYHRRTAQLDVKQRVAAAAYSQGGFANTIRIQRSA